MKHTFFLLIHACQVGWFHCCPRSWFIFGWSHTDHQIEGWSAGLWWVQISYACLQISCRWKSMCCFGFWCQGATTAFTHPTSGKFFVGIFNFVHADIEILDVEHDSWYVVLFTWIKLIDQSTMYCVICIIIKHYNGTLYWQTSFLYRRISTKTISSFSSG